MLFLFVLMFVAFALLSEKGMFLKVKNLMQIVNAMPLSILLTTGITLLMISGKLDFSTGANGTLCAIILAYILRAGLPLAPSIIIALLIGVLVGFINAVLVNELRMAPFIATLATSSVATGFVYFIANKNTINLTNKTLIALGKNMVFWGYVPISALFALAFMIIAGIVLHKTRFGRKIYLIGGNAQASTLSGINAKLMSYVLFMICGLFSGMAGVMFVARQQSANMLGITGARYQGITAAVLGGIAFGGGSGGMAGAFVGLLILNTFSNGLSVMGVNPYVTNISTGLLLILALVMDYFQKKQSMKVIA
jgi:ribose/xylose/arabinose/galactoside ABC-type transport system permease subunit